MAQPVGGEQGALEAEVNAPLQCRRQYDLHVGERHSYTEVSQQANHPRRRPDDIHNQGNQSIPREVDNYDHYTGSITTVDNGGGRHSGSEVCREAAADGRRCKPAPTLPRFRSGVGGQADCDRTPGV